MILLDATTKSLQVALSGAMVTNNSPVTVAYSDVTVGTATLYAASESDTATNGTGAVTIAAAPASGNTRKIQYISIYNADTAAITATISVNNNSTLRTVFVSTLQVGEQLVYQDSNGWQTYTAAGVLKTSSNNVAAPTAWSVNDFRLTVVSGNAVPQLDVTTTAMTLYLTPIFNNGSITTAYGNIALSDANGNITILNSQEKSYSLGTLTSGAIYDVFAYNNSGTLTLYLGPAWSNYTAGGSSQARTTALASNYGLLTLSGSPQYRYVGSICMASTTATADSSATRYVYNVQNQVMRTAFSQISSGSTGSTTAVEQTYCSMLFGLPNSSANVAIGAVNLYNASNLVSAALLVGFNGSLTGVNTPGVADGLTEVLVNPATSTKAPGYCAATISTYLGVNQAAVCLASGTSTIVATASYPMVTMQANI